jgi:hypothetical protein
MPEEIAKVIDAGRVAGIPVTWRSWTEKATAR